MRESLPKDLQNLQVQVTTYTAVAEEREETHSDDEAKSVFPSTVSGRFPFLHPIVKACVSALTAQDLASRPTEYHRNER